jgi:hypothetical protein
LREEPNGVVTTAMNARKRQNYSASLRYLGWTARPSDLRLPVAGEVFLLTSPFIERRYRKNEVSLQMIP